MAIGFLTSGDDDDDDDGGDDDDDDDDDDFGDGDDDGDDDDDDDDDGGDDDDDDDDDDDVKTTAPAGYRDGDGWMEVLLWIFASHHEPPMGEMVQLPSNKCHVPYTNRQSACMLENAVVSKLWGNEPQDNAENCGTTEPWKSKIHGLDSWIVKTYGFFTMI